MTGLMAGPQNRSNTSQNGSELGNICMALIMQGPAINHENSGQSRIESQFKTSGDS